MVRPWRRFAGRPAYRSRVITDLAALLRQAGLGEDIDRLIPFSEYRTALELAAEATDRPHFGMDWTVSMPDHFPNLGPIVLLTDWRGRTSGPNIDSMSGV